MSKQLFIQIVCGSIIIVSSFATGFYIDYYQNVAYSSSSLYSSKPSGSVLESLVVLDMLDSREYQNLTEAIERILSTEISFLCAMRDNLSFTRAKIFFHYGLALSAIERTLWKADNYLSDGYPIYKLPEECGTEPKIQNGGDRYGGTVLLERVRGGGAGTLD